MSLPVLTTAPDSKNCPETAVDALRDALSDFNGKSNLSILDIGPGCLSRLELANALQWKCFGVDPDIHENFLTQDHATAAFIVRRVEDLIPHAFDLIFIAKLPNDERAAAALMFKLFSLGAVTPSTRLVSGIEHGAEKNGWDRKAFLAKLHFRDIEALGTITSAQNHCDRSWETKVQGKHDPVISRYWVRAAGSDFTSFMQERYVPGTWSKIAEYEHMPRYALSERYTRGKAVLDFGCGTGYGSAILAKSAYSVVGLDIDSAALAWARDTHHSDRLTFHRCSDLGANLADALFDVVTCFEMIEHVDYATQKATIASIARLLKADGVLIISTPNPDVTQMYGENPYHLREMTLPQFQELLGAHFNHIEILEQRILNSVTFESPNSSRSSFLARAAENSTASAAPAAFIALCSRFETNTPSSTVFFDEESDSIFETLQAEKRANLAKMAVYTLREQLQNTNNTVKQVSSALQITQALLTTDVSSLAGVLREQAAVIATMDDAIAAQSRNIERLGTAIATRDASLKERDDALTVQSQLIESLGSKLTEADATLSEMQAAAAANAGMMAKLHQRIEATNQQHTRAILAREQMLAGKNNALARQGENIGRLRQQVAEQSVALQDLLRIKASKWQRLHDAIKARPITLRNLIKAAYLVGAMSSPNWARRRFGPSIQIVRRKVDPVKKERRADIAKRESDQGEKVDAASPPGTPALESAVVRAAYSVRLPLQNKPQRWRVVHVIANFCLGGSSRLVVDLIECLGSEFDHSVVTSYIPNPPDYTGLQITEYAGIPEVSQFVSHFVTYDPDLVHVHYWGDCDEIWYSRAIAAAEQLNIPIIENVNTPVDPYFSDGISQYIYVSKYVQQRFGKIGPNHTTIFPGSDFGKFARLKNSAMPDDCIGMVYRLERDKLNENAIAPFIETVKIRPQTRVLIVGGGSLLSSFVTATKEAGVFQNFEFTNYVAYDKLPDYYRRMSLFVAPVWKESFGQVAAFAMNMHIPVCGFDVGAIAEIIDEPDLVAPAGDSDKLARIICKLLDDLPLREKLGSKMHRRAQTLFSQKAMIEAYASIYNATLEGIDE
ncbi:methyltransferase domain-containing protein [Variovorax humicola]|uniref:Methyltransferase domain-containing protein n=1 Tax=Variovorax humicola TaxID=1769758 RepID=A0ABU8W1R5_9BURK